MLVPSPPAEASPVRDSARRAARLLLAFLACSISFTLILRARMVPLGDLYSPWYGMQQLLNHGRNPYGPEVSGEIQLAFYGHLLQPAEEMNEQRFAYPIYVVVLLWPMAFMKYSTASAIALPLLIAAGAAFILACARFVDWPASKSDQLAAVLFGLSTGPMLRALRVEQLTTLVALFLMAAFVALTRRRLVSAGILLALATFKPQIALLPILWAVVWAFSKWPERKKLLLGLAGMEAVLLVVGQVLLPGWLTDFVRGLPAYGRYAGRDSLLTMLAGEWAGLAATVLLSGAGAWAVYSSRKKSATSGGFQLTTALVLALAAVGMPAMAAGHNQILMFPAAFLLLRDARMLGFGLTTCFAAFLSWTPLVALATRFSGHKDFVYAVNTGVGAVVPLILMVFLVRYASRWNAAADYGEGSRPSQ